MWSSFHSGCSKSDHRAGHLKLTQCRRSVNSLPLHAHVFSLHMTGFGSVSRLPEEFLGRDFVDLFGTSCSPPWLPAKQERQNYRQQLNPQDVECQPVTDSCVVHNRCSSCWCCSCLWQLVLRASLGQDGARQQSCGGNCPAAVAPGIVLAGVLSLVSLLSPQGHALKLVPAFLLTVHLRYRRQLCKTH